jgi:hypothetical protein
MAYLNYDNSCFLILCLLIVMVYIITLPYASHPAPSESSFGAYIFV